MKIPGHNRNEALDCRDYALAGFKIIDPDTLALEQRLKGMTGKQPPKKAAAQQPRRTKPASYFDEW